MEQLIEVERGCGTLSRSIVREDHLLEAARERPETLLGGAGALILG
jgi:hypothetical protein